MSLHSQKTESLLQRIRNANNRSISASCMQVFRYLEDNVDSKNPFIRKFERHRKEKWAKWPKDPTDWEVPTEPDDAKSLAYDLYATLAEDSFDFAMDMYQQDADDAIDSLNDDFLDFFRDAISDIFEAESKSDDLGKVPAKRDKTKVFIVHGRNLKIRDAVFNFLRALKLHPLEWTEITASTGKVAPFIGEVLDQAFSEAQAVLVLLTPEDEVKLKQEFIQDDDPDYETQMSLQARPNVLFEGGMAMGSHPDRTIFVQFGKIRPFSDILGRHILRMNNSAEKRMELAEKLETAGCAVSKAGKDWLKVGEFE